MSEKEIVRLSILERVILGKLSQKRASEVMKLSLRQVKRLCRRYKDEGAQGLVHRSRGKLSGRRMKEDVEVAILKAIEDKEFEGFGPTLLQETLKEEKGINISREWLRQRMIQAGKWHKKKTKKVESHPRRKRRAREGELIQLDGSYEAWFEERGPRCCLLVCIDDATSKIMAMRFVGHETTEGYLDLMKRYVRLHGVPLALLQRSAYDLQSPKGGDRWTV